MTDRSPQNLLEQAMPWFEAAYARYAPDEDLKWAAGLMTFPNEQGQLMTSIALYAHLPGAVAETAIVNTAVVQLFALSEEHADNTVREQVEHMKRGRSEQLATMMQQAEQAANNGRSAPASGLITP